MSVANVKKVIGLITSFQADERAAFYTAQSSVNAMKTFVADLEDTYNITLGLETDEFDNLRIFPDSSDLEEDTVTKAEEVGNEICEAMDARGWYPDPPG